MSRKKFELNQNINTGLSKMVKLSENYHSLHDNQTIDLEDIKVDPTNPRKLSLTKSDIEKASSVLNLLPSDEHFFERMGEALKKLIPKNADNKEKRLSENEKLIELAFSIQKNGLLHPILVYKDAGDYFIVAGERRFLAHILLKKEHIEVKSFKEKPSGLNRKMSQWVENIQRDDLSLYSKLLNIKDIEDEYKKETNDKLTSSVLCKISGMTKSPASKYLSVLKRSEDVFNAIKIGQLKDLELAASISRIEDPAKRKELIDAIKQGANRKEIRDEIKNPVSEQKKGVGRGRKANKVSFGHSNNTNTARIIIESVLEKNKFPEILSAISTVNWDDYSEVSKIFKKLVSELDGKK